MSPRGSDVRERMLDSTTTLIRQRGASATSLDDILAHSGAPRGSLYYYFPGGRTQLIEETVERAGASIEQLIASAGDHSPIETDDETPQLTEAAARAFTSWRSALAALLRRHGASPAEARRLANLVIAAVEGAVALSRAEQSPQPLDDAARALRPLLQRTTAPHSKKP